MGKKKGWGNKVKGTMHRKSTASKTSPTANLAASPPADAADEEEGEDAAAPSPTPPVVVDHEVGEREEAEAPMPAPFVWCPPPPPFDVDALVDAALDICVEHVFNYEVVVGALAHDVVEMPPFCIRKATYYREWYNRYEELHEVGERDWSKSECDEHGILFQQWEMYVAVLNEYQVLGSSLGLGRDHECPGCGRLTAKDCECFRECDCDDGHHNRYPWYRDYVCEAGRPHTAIYSLFRDGDVVWL